MSNEAKAIQNYLQYECSDFWHVKENNGIIECSFINDYRFSVFKDDDNDWHITGTEISLNIAYNIAIILDENY